MMNLENANYNSEKRLTMLKKRSKRCVCKYCGGQLELRKIIFSEFEDSRVEIFCQDCDRIEFGVEAAIYNCAKYFVENSKFQCYPELDESEKTKQMNIAKVCEIMAWQDKTLGVIDSEGFTVPVNSKEHIIGECVTLTDADLDDIEIKVQYME